MTHVVKKPHIKTKKKEDNRGKEEEEEAAEDRGQPVSPIELETRLPHTEMPTLDDADMVEADDRTEKPQEQKQQKPPHPRRIWSKSTTTSTKHLYETARTPQKISKDTIAEERQHPIHSKRQVEEEMRSMLEKMQELNIQMKAEADQIRSSGSAATEQIVEQYEGLQTQIRKLTDISQRHEDEIEDLRCISDYTHELVLDRENRESATKMIVKAWPREASYYDRSRITYWLVEKAGVQNVKQEHGYYTQSRKFQLSPVSILTFADQDDRQRFERFAYTSFSGKFPLYYWNEKGDYVQHHKGGRHRLIITNYISKTDLTLNLTLTTLLHILTTHDASPYKGQDTLSHRPTDKQIYNFRAKQVVAKTTYDRDQGIAAIVLEKGLMDIVKEKWHEGWKEAHKDHPRFSNYIRYPYAISFAEARLEDERQEIRSSE